MEKIKNFFKFIGDKILEGIGSTIIVILTLIALPVWIIKYIYHYIIFVIEKLQEKIKKKTKRMRDDREN